jgi:DNA-binding beta-propeller fold protein YncE
MRHIVCTSLLLICSTLAAMDRLPTGVKLDAAGRLINAGNMPLAMVLAPDGRHVVVSLCGYLHQGLQVVDLESGSVVQTIDKKSTFLGLAFDGDTLYASGGHDNVVYVLAWKDARLTDQKSIAVNYPAGLALSPDRKTLYAAENLADDIAVIDVASSNVVQRLATDHYPYAVVLGGDRVYVSAWGGNTVSTFRVTSDQHLAATGRVNVGRHPSALLLDGSTLYVALASTDDIAVVDTKTRAIRRFEDKSPRALREGSTPNALAISGGTLFVAEADNNSIALFNMTTGALMGRIPTDWYPLSLIAQKDRLIVLNGKGAQTLPNPGASHPGQPPDETDYDLSMVNGTIRVVPLPVGDLAAMTDRVTRANHWNETRSVHKYPPFKHVIYIIKENRTYDQILGDIAAGDGDRSLVFFGRDVSPNHHALAERFGLFDRFFVNAEVSSQGHVWSDAAYVTDYTEKTVHTAYAHKRPDVDEGEVDEPAEGFLWDSAIRKGMSLRVYGEFGEADEKTKRYRASKRTLKPDMNPDYPDFNMKISDQHRADIWLAEFDEYVKSGELPVLEIMSLPRDHTGGGKAGYSTPRACMADNDFALARIVEAVSASPYWADTVFFVLEDDAQDGPDHVDCHRSVLFVISAYNRAGVIHRFTNTTDVVATIEEILGLDPLSQFDSYGHPLADVFADAPDLAPYHALKESVPLDEVNPDKGKAAKKSASFDLTRPDAVDDELFNEVLWEMVKGAPATPAVR